MSSTLKEACRQSTSQSFCSSNVALDPLPPPSTPVHATPPLILRHSTIIIPTPRIMRPKRMLITRHRIQPPTRLTPIMTQVIRQLLDEPRLHTTYPLIPLPFLYLTHLNHPVVPVTRPTYPYIVIQRLTFLHVVRNDIPKRAIVAEILIFVLPTMAVAAVTPEREGISSVICSMVHSLEFILDAGYAGIAVRVAAFVPGPELVIVDRSNEGAAHPCSGTC